MVVLLVIVLVVAVGAVLLLNNSGEPKSDSDTNIPLPVNSPDRQLPNESTQSKDVLGKESTGSAVPLKRYSSPPQMNLSNGKDYQAIMHTSKGNLTIDLFESETPETVNNFVFLSKEKFYEGTRFHRIIKDFMIQGGDPLGNGTGGPGYKFNDEKITREYTRGRVAMANSGPNTNGSQFFIMTKDTPLPKAYVIFGEVTDGFDTLDKIADTKVQRSLGGELSDPTSDVTITSIDILEKDR